MFHYYAIKDYKNAHTFIVKIGVCKITLNYINPFPEGTKGPKIHFNLIYIEEYKKNNKKKSRTYLSSLHYMISQLCNFF